MKRILLYLQVSIIFVFFSSCEKNDFLGPSIETLYGELIILEPFSNNKPIGVDFSTDDTVKFNCTFSISADYQINIIGKTSGANYTLNGVASDLSQAYWCGESNDVFFKQSEFCDIRLSFNGHDTILSDSLLILGERDFSNLGVLLTSFEDPSEYSTVTGSNTVQLDANSNPNFAIHGINYLNALGSGSETWFGAVRFIWPSGPIIVTDPSNVYFNGFFSTEYPGSAFVLKVFEDENANGSYDAGVDEAYSIKIALNDDDQWHKKSVNLNDLVIDQSGNNALVNGVLKPENIIRIDVTNSQSGTAQGDYGYSADYFLITYNEPL